MAKLDLKQTAEIYICAIRRVMKDWPSTISAGADRSQARAKARAYGAETAMLVEAEKLLRKGKYLRRGRHTSDLVPSELGMRVVCPAGLGRAKRGR